MMTISRFEEDRQCAAASSHPGRTTTLSDLMPFIKYSLPRGEEFELSEVDPQYRRRNQLRITFELNNEEADVVRTHVNLRTLTSQGVTYRAWHVFGLLRVVLRD